MTFGKLNHVSVEKQLTAAEAAVSGILFCCTPQKGASWVRTGPWGAFWGGLAPPGLNIDTWPQDVHEEWSVEQLSVWLFDNTGLMLHSRYIPLLSLPKTPAYPQMLPGYHFTYLGQPAFIDRPVYVSHGVGAWIPVTYGALLQDYIIKAAVSYRRAT